MNRRKGALLMVLGIVLILAALGPFFASIAQKGTDYWISFLIAVALGSGGWELLSVGRKMRKDTEP